MMGQERPSVKGERAGHGEGGAAVRAGLTIPVVPEDGRGSRPRASTWWRTPGASRGDCGA